MLGTLGHHGQSHPGEPYRGELVESSDYQTETPTPTETSTPTETPTETQTTTQTETPANESFQTQQGQNEQLNAQNASNDDTGGIPVLNRFTDSSESFGLGIGLLGVLGGGGYLAYRRRSDDLSDQREVNQED